MRIVEADTLWGSRGTYAETEDATKLDTIAREKGLWFKRHLR